MFRPPVKDATSTIRMTPKNGRTEIIDLGVDWFDSPIMVLQSTNANTYFCVYDDDIDWQLLRIAPGQPYVPPPPKSAASGIILNSTCRIEAVAKSDSNQWHEVAAALNAMSPGEYNRKSFRLFRLRPPKEYLEATMRNLGND